MNKVKKRCCVASGARLAYSDAKQLLEKAVATDEVWAFTLSQFIKKQCNHMSAHVNKTFLPLMRVNRHMPRARAAVYGPKRWGDWNQIQMYTTFSSNIVQWCKCVEMGSQSG